MCVEFITHVGHPSWKAYWVTRYMSPYSGLDLVSGRSWAGDEDLGVMRVYVLLPEMRGWMG